MTAQPITASAERLDLIIIDLIDEFGRRLEAGDPIDVEAFVAEHAEYAERLRKLLPAVLGLAKLGHSRALTDAIAEELKSGSNLGDFTIVREIGRGGMGVVYEAFQESLGRSVALKVLGQSSGRDFLERFRREARVVARLHHTNIVPIFGIGQAAGFHFFAMQLIEGDSLDIVLKSSQRRANAHATSAHPLLGAAETETAASAPTALTVRDMRGDRLRVPGNRDYYRAVAEIGLQISHGLSYAHEQGILHRDVKPSNVLLDETGTARITDFGLAKVEGEDGLTTTGNVVGTLRYMAPERFVGRCDVQSDIYGLGATLYELLTLRPVFDEPDRPQLLARILRGSPDSPAAYCRDLPLDLQTIVMTALDHEPGRRYQSAAAMAEDLQHFLADRSIKARSQSRMERAWRWCRRFPITATLLAALVVSILGGFTGVFLQWQRAELKASEASDERDLAQKSERDAIFAKDQSDVNLRRARETVSQLSRTAGDLFRLEGKTESACKIIERATAIHEGFLKENPENWTLLPAAIQEWERLAVLREQLKQYPAAIRAEQRAVALADRLVIARPGVWIRQSEWASRKAYLGKLLAAGNKPKDAEVHLSEAIATYRAFLETNPTDSRAQQRAQFSCARDLVLCADTQIKIGKPDEALQSLDEAIVRWSQLISTNTAAKPNAIHKWNLELIQSFERARKLLKGAGRSMEARVLLVREMAVYWSLMDKFPENSATYGRRLADLSGELAFRFVDE